MYHYCFYNVKDHKALRLCDFKLYFIQSGNEFQFFRNYIVKQICRDYRVNINCDVKNKIKSVPLATTRNKGATRDLTL